ncbi:MAG: hypothetical protein JXO51_07775 [Candidatus Aminicenantes bacterium]|nr:hypothetical protein [Candidatus Aminicenantes bacterium]
MPESTTPSEKDNIPASQATSGPSADVPHGAGPAAARPPETTPESEATAVTEGAAAAAPPGAGKKPGAAPVKAAPGAAWPKHAWLIVAVGLLLILILFFVATRPRQKTAQVVPTAAAQDTQEESAAAGYPAFLAERNAARDERYAERVLTDEPYAGQAPLAPRADGPLVSAEIDAQLAALADAFRIRIQILQPSQQTARGRTVSRVTRGDFRGFKVTVVEPMVEGKIVSEEITVITPLNGVFKTVNHVLQDVQRTDFSRILSEIRNAGLEPTLRPGPSGKKTVQALLRAVRHWGKPVAEELLISGDRVGAVPLGLPTRRLKSRLPDSYDLLKRKVLVDDVYYDVYKVLDGRGEPLFYIYEKEGAVWGITVVNDVFKTEMGVGIGSSLDRLRIHYPSIKLAYSERKTPYVRIDGIQGIFIIQENGEKKIVSILIGNSPEFP